MISVVIPVYNTEKYLGRCIDSVLCSTFRNFEMILVDDGSTDHSLDICRRYSQKDKRIKLFSQGHSGVCAARNKGIELSRGEWVVFVDSDDMISCDFLETIAGEEYQDCDILIFDYARRDRRLGAKRRKRTAKAERYVRYYRKRHMASMIRKMLYAETLEKDGNSSLLSPCAKAYRTSVIQQYSIRFPDDIIIGEDKLFNIMFYLKMKKCAYIPKIVYYVRWRSDSATHCFQPEFVKNYIRFQRRLKRLLKKHGIFFLLEDAYYENVLSAMTEVLVFGIFNPDSTRSYRRNCRLCRMVRENEIYSSAARYCVNTGNTMRRILLFFFNLECFGMVELICKVSYFVMRRIKK